MFPGTNGPCVPTPFFHVEIHFDRAKNKPGYKGRTRFSTSRRHLLNFTETFRGPGEGNGPLWFRRANGVFAGPFGGGLTVVGGFVESSRLRERRGCDDKGTFRLLGNFTSESIGYFVGCSCIRSCLCSRIRDILKFFKYSLEILICWNLKVSFHLLENFHVCRFSFWV